MKNKIINFHDVRDINWFEKTLNIIKGKYDLIGIKDIENFYYDNKRLKNTCHLTIDDGDKTFYNYIYPVLKKMYIPATIFVSPKISSDLSNFWFQEIRTLNQDKLKKIISEIYNIDINVLKSYPTIVILKNMNINQIWTVINRYRSIFRLQFKGNNNMSIEQLREIDREGLITIGAHTMNHPILANENEESSKKEIVNSVKELENILQHEVRYFAYPNGTPKLDYTAREIEILKNTNCRLAFSTEAKNFSLTDNPLSIPRYGFSKGRPLFVETKLILGKYWNSIKSIKSSNEIKLRFRLYKKIDFSKLQM